MSIISVRNISKEFKITKRNPGLWGHIQALFSGRSERKTVLENINFEIAEEEIVGIIGPNGAGKSTLIKILCGILNRSSGIVDVIGIDPFKKRIENARNIGCVFGQRTQLCWDLPVRESFDLARYLYKIPRDVFNGSFEYLKDVFGLDDILEIPARKLSLGQKVKSDLALSLLHRPRVLYLDEPTIGLDILAKDRLKKYLIDINKTLNTTVIITTHDLFDIEKLCSRLIIMDKGSIVLDELMEQFLKTHALKKTLVVDFAEEVKTIEVMNTSVISRELPRARLQITPGGNISQIVSEIMSKYKILDFSVEEPGIEDIIKDIYEKLD